MMVGEQAGILGYDLSIVRIGGSLVCDRLEGEKCLRQEAVCRVIG